MMNDIVILLSASVHPAGMSYTKLQNPQARLNQYLKAICFYIKHTTYKILIVENTGYDFSIHFHKEIKENRLECITFNGNTYDKKLGKGFGEGLILKYAFNKSEFISKSNIIIKITGRYCIRNINSINKSILYLSRNKHNFIAADAFPKIKYISSSIIIAEKSFYTDYFIPNIELINDSQNVYFEHILYQAIINYLLNKNYFIQFPFAVRKEGISGTTGKKTNKVSLITSIKKTIKFIWATSATYRFFCIN